MTVFTRLEDPRVLTLVLTALVSAMLWVATWASMSGMEMSGMDMSGMKIPSGGMDAGVRPEAGGHMRMSGGMDGPDWSLATLGATAAMWVLMMAAMMLPAMAPVMSVYATVAAKEDAGARLALRIALFALSYFLIWAAFSVVAALGQLALRDSAWFTMGGTLATPILAGALMVVAGVWQFTALKDVCLRHCRHPLQYLLTHWREGLAGAFPVGLRHGLYCFGCCVAFMGLMFVFGAMNIWCMAAIAVYLLAEKVLPGAFVWGKVVGGALIAVGCATMALTI